MPGKIGISKAILDAERRRRAKKKNTIPPKDPMPTTGPGIDPNIKVIQRKKEIPKGSKGAGLRALPPSVVEDMGYAATTRLNPLMQLETLKPMNAPAMGALTRPMEQMPLSRMYNSALPRASKLSKAKFL